MIRIKTINSEVEIWKSIVTNFKQYRAIDQKAFYLGAGAALYYHPDKKFTGESYDYSTIARLIARLLTQNKGAKVAVVSLGCGNCEKDKIILEQVQAMGHNVRFFGVDSSIAMLHKANRVLSDVTFEAHLICADVGAFHFKRELDRIIGAYDLGLYLFFGNTFGNLNQSYIAEALKKSLRPGDYMLLDIIGFEHITPQIKGMLLERYEGFLKNPPDTEFYLHPLKAFGIPVDCGRLSLDVTKHNASQAQVFTFGFKITTLTDFSLEEDELTLSPNEYIQLGDILIYDLKELIKFLETKKFALKDQLIGDFMNQLLLQRQ